MFPDPLISVRMPENSSNFPRLSHPHSWFSMQGKMVINDSFIHLIYLFVKQLSTTRSVCSVVCSCVQTKQISHNSPQMLLLEFSKEGQRTQFYNCFQICIIMTNSSVAWWVKKNHFSSRSPGNGIFSPLFAESCRKMLEFSFRFPLTTLKQTQEACAPKNKTTKWNCNQLRAS